MKCMCRGGLDNHLASLFAQKHAIFLHASVRCKFIFIYFYMFQDLRRKGKQIKKNNFPFIALHSSNQHPSQASLSVWLSVVLKFASLVKNQLWFYSYRTTRFVSLIFPALLSYFQYSFRQSQRANFIATERIRRFLSKFRIFWEITRLFEFSFKRMPRLQIHNQNWWERKLAKTWISWSKPGDGCVVFVISL